MRFKHQASTLLQAATLLLEHGIPPRRLIQAIGLPTSVLLDADAWIPRRLAMRFAPELERLTGDYFCGLHVGELNRIDQFGRWGEGILRAVTLRESLRFAAHRIDLIETGTLISLDCRGDRAHLVFHFEGELGGDPRHHLEASLVVLRKILDLAREQVPAEVHFVHPQPRGAVELERLFGPQLAFGREANALVFDHAALDLPLRPARSSPAASQPTPISPSSPRETARAVFQIIRERLEYERPTVALAAAALRMSSRTLQRHLAAWGLSFDEILDDYRKRKALAYLSDGRHSITDIGFRLGYSDAAHFTRAFRRWTGDSPRAALAAVQQRGLRGSFAVGPNLI
jgi:AraC-like DNA-binding protein